ncbi:hypothetical protein DSO57_1034612 [Entomophthora muscae]|uniref:Uncharacterized protein n=1 Tax=Entomophthora muscae TaxID=34485 RepID=A0ACC2TXP5_9FUNG|nr:hypothetical protein DSO57_1034612 [Entomophthora muscae]
MGLRDAILVDCITFTSQQGSELVANLNKTYLNESALPVFICIEGYNSLPSVASKELTQLWNTTLKSFTACLCKSLEKNNLSNTLDDLICYSAPPSVMIPLTGYLLGYPVVYCYLFHPSPPMHHTLPDACYPVPPKNCLSGLELVVIKASIKAQPEFLDFQNNLVMSFSVPACLHVQAEIYNAIEAWKKGFKLQATTILSNATPSNSGIEAHIDSISCTQDYVAL